VSDDRYVKQCGRVDVGTKQKADAHVPVRDQLGLAIISAFRKLK
jgi:hypothetical protein